MLFLRSTLSKLRSAIIKPFVSFYLFYSFILIFSPRAAQSCTEPLSQACVILSLHRLVRSESQEKLCTQTLSCCLAIRTLDLACLTSFVTLNYREGDPLIITAGHRRCSNFIGLELNRLVV